MGAQRDLLQVMTFGVVLFTLLVQSTTMLPLIRWLKIITRNEALVEYESQHARLTALRNADKRLDRMHNEGLLSSHTSDRLKEFISQQAIPLTKKVQNLLLSDPALEAEELDTGWREIMRAQRSALLDLRRDGVISDEVFDELSTEIDAQLSEGPPALADGVETRTQFFEVTVPDDSIAAGKTIVDLKIPRTAVLVSIQRGNETIIPRGDTLLHVGDVVTTLCERETIPSVKQILLTNDGADEKLST
jgi:TrkA-C domain